MEIMSIMNEEKTKERYSGAYWVIWKSGWEIFIYSRKSKSWRKSFWPFRKYYDSDFTCIEDMRAY